MWLKQPLFVLLGCQSVLDAAHLRLSCSHSAPCLLRQYLNYRRRGGLCMLLLNDVLPCSRVVCCSAFGPAVSPFVPVVGHR